VREKRRRKEERNNNKRKEGKGDHLGLVFIDAFRLATLK